MVEEATIHGLIEIESNARRETRDEHTTAAQRNPQNSGPTKVDTLKYYNNNFSTGTYSRTGRYRYPGSRYGGTKIDEST